MSRQVDQAQQFSGSAPEVLVLDSGVGGLSICESLLKEMPELKLIYVADDAFFPYGMMEEQALTERLITLTTAMLERFQPALVVLACNTVSTLLLPHLRERFEVPFVGVVPAIKPAAQITRSGHIALLATPATVSRVYTRQLIQDFAGDCEVTMIASNELVHEAERFLLTREFDPELISEALKVIESNKGGVAVDTVVLGCTHFPLVREQLKSLWPEVTWVDSGEAISRRVKHLLQEDARLSLMSPPDKPVHSLFFTSRVPEGSAFIHSLHGMGLGNVSLQKLCF